ncbi:uncharacterized protein LOC106656134 [Trichogramma pretiosum]|uniref:uncharacterized protein LOC106656134 n=1 Tax=Trichogramma pretiosum TaxID=7493 RepID=UPI0006C9BF8D|nr:uncharacterized protein LOC106656134 [Trichogramma pretiosum]
MDKSEQKKILKRDYTRNKREILAEKRAKSLARLEKMNIEKRQELAIKRNNAGSARTREMRSNGPKKKPVQSSPYFLRQRKQNSAVVPSPKNLLLEQNSKEETPEVDQRNVGPENSETDTCDDSMDIENDPSFANGCEIVASKNDKSIENYTCSENDNKLIINLNEKIATTRFREQKLRRIVGRLEKVIKRKDLLISQWRNKCSKLRKGFAMIREEEITIKMSKMCMMF